VIWGTDEAAKAVTRSTLYTCLDVGLRLLHPLMPFVSEELYQRLPRRNDDSAPSLCVTAYPLPEQFEGLRDEQLESNVTFTYECIKSVRSMKATYQLPNKTQVDVWLKCSDASVQTKLSGFSEFITKMINANKLEITTSDDVIPRDCAISTVGSEAEVHLLLKGIINVEKELASLKTKKSQLSEKKTKLEESINKPDYMKKVPESVREDNSTKLTDITKEQTRLESAIEKLEAMQLEEQSA